MSVLQEKIISIKKEFDDISDFLDERRIRLWGAAKAKAYNCLHNHGGVMAVHKATGISRPRIYLGLKEITSEERLDKSRIRMKGGGRKKVTQKQPTLLKALECLVEPLTRGNPESPLRWTCKSTYKLRDELVAKGYQISQPKVGELLSELGYSLQSNRKTDEGGKHPDRNAQFEKINETVKSFQEQGLPSISVDTKKKENIGNYANKGKEYHKKGQPEEVNVYDFINKELGKVAPYGIYDLFKNEGFVNVGISSDTAEFAVNSIRSWWDEMGKAEYPNATQLLITADCGGSNGYKVRLWKTELQEFADETGMIINVCHFPPGTSKWNKIEHRMFCCISQNWRGKPLITRETVVNLIGNTKTKTGLKIKAKLDENIYEKGRKITDKELESICIEKSDFHGEWNYKIKPKKDVL
ncbi:MAG: ISAzo13 family transposase [bacterium]|nr:ISAzo13 family transposase [bacterium]